MGLAALAACGGAEFDGQEASADDATARYAYKCPGMHRYVQGKDYPQDFWLRLAGTNARRETTEAGLATAGDLKFDSGWSITSSSREYVRYTGTVGGIAQEVRVEPALRKGGYALRNGSEGGYAKIIGRASNGYDIWSGICFRQ